MILQGIAEASPDKGLNGAIMQQTTYDKFFEAGQKQGKLHAIEGRVYAENAAENFAPCPGLLQHVSLCEVQFDWLRVDSWVRCSFLT